MADLEKTRRLSKLCEFIRSERTGGLEKLSEKLNVSRVSVYYYIQELKFLGAQIEYDRQRKTYYFNNSFNFKLSISSK